MDRPKTSSSMANFKRKGVVKIKKSALGRVQSASTLDTAKQMPSRASKTAKSGKFGTVDSDMTYKKDYKGIPFKTFVDRYGKREDGGFGIKGYKTPNTSYPQQALSAKHVLHYHQVDPKKDASYMNAIIKHAKEIPDPRKYQDTLLVNWCKPQMECKFKIPVSNSHETFKGKFG